MSEAEQVEVIDPKGDVLVTFRRYRSGLIHQMGFRCGEANPGLILRESWNTNSQVIRVEGAA